VLGLVAALLALAGIGRGFVNPSGAGTPHLMARPTRTQFTADPSPSDSPTPSDVPTSETPLPEQPRNEPPPQLPVEPPPGYQGPPATNPAEAVANAATAGRSRVSQLAVALLDRRTGTLYAAGSVDYAFASASLVKVFIATRLLAEGRASDPAVADEMWRMIVASDDDAATDLYNLVGTEDVVPWVANRYGISGLQPASIHNYWGLTRVTARAMVAFYNRVAGDSAVGPWLLNAMANAQATASDGFPQYFGIPSAADQWRVKQGWMCCLEGVTRMHSTGLIEGDRYAVALLTEGPRSMYGNYGAMTLTVMAQALLPQGTVPRSAPDPEPQPTPSPTPSPSLTPSPTSSPSRPPSPTPTRSPRSA
jgi:hypothetical protein